MTIKQILKIAVLDRLLCVAYTAMTTHHHKHTDLTHEHSQIIQEISQNLTRSNVT